MGVRAVTNSRLARPVRGAAPAPSLFQFGRVLSFTLPETNPMNRNNREFYNDIVAKIIEQLKKHPYTEIVEGDLFVGVTKKHSDRTVDVLVDGAAYVDDKSFRIDYSEPRHSRHEQFLRDGMSEVEMDAERIPDRSGSVVVRLYSETTVWFVAPRDLVALLNMLKFTDESDESPMGREYELLAEPMRILPYSEMIDTERRAIMFEKYHVISVRAIADCLKEHGAFDFAGLDFVIYVSDRNMVEMLNDYMLDVDESCYIVRVDKVSYRDEISFLLEGGSHSLVVRGDDRASAPCVMLLDIMRLRYAVECIMRTEKRETLPPIDTEGWEIERILRHEGLQREALEDIVETRQRIARRYLAAKER